ncbi:TPA: hypothetical protein N0F65_009147 [Lagenidium giganteum]|uniref:Ankyrin repeat domain-containing protein n=1 Tax=Lagenidium giganteum TaxID=4803 RepID=A0AAV2YNY3_9STRA|nr:TPA: hypothetical protein N0F65_009147 [Lagenidium giganteum]
MTTGPVTSAGHGGKATANQAPSKERRTLPDVLPLHAAIWDGNLDRVRAILSEAQRLDTAPAHDDNNATTSTSVMQKLLEAKDLHGNSALHVALRVVQPTQRAIVQLLLEHGASVTSRNKAGWSCLQDATLADDEYLVAMAFIQGEKQFYDFIQARQESMFEAIEKLPDFETEIHLEARSWIPVVSKMLPSDTIHVWKRGSSLRCDFSLVGIDGIKWKRASMSHVYLGRGSERPGHAIVINHDKRVYYDLTQAFSQPSLENIDIGLHLLITSQLSASAMDSSQIQFKRTKDVVAVKKKNIERCPWTGTKYEMKNFSVSASFRAPVNKHRQRRFGGDESLKSVERFVDQLAMHTKKHKKTGKPSKIKSMRATHFGSDDERELSDPHESSSSELSAPKTGSQNPSQQEMWLAKGKKMEMHLDVCAGDTIKWHSLVKSKEFSFDASYYYDDQVVQVCRSAGVKNVPIVGAFDTDHNGSFVLSWQNTQKTSLLERRGIKITYSVTHARPAATPAAPSHSRPSIVALPSIISEDSEFINNQEQQRWADLWVKSQQFNRMDHIPNPMTATTSFLDYFGDQSIRRSPQEETKVPLFSLTPTKEKPPQPVQFFDDDDSAATPIADGYRNTYRSLTLLPSVRAITKNFEAKLLMTESFPFSLHDFLPVIEFLSNTGDHVKNLREFFNMKLPPGFPVKFELPMMLTVRIAYTFRTIELRNDIDASLFDMPDATYDQVQSFEEVGA